jgi:hypothetical protein
MRHNALKLSLDTRNVFSLSLFSPGLLNRKLAAKSTALHKRYMIDVMKDLILRFLESSGIKSESCE